jgi:hypothetical protein
MSDQANDSDRTTPAPANAAPKRGWFRFSADGNAAPYSSYPRALGGCFLFIALFMGCLAALMVAQFFDLVPAKANVTKADNAIVGTALCAAAAFTTYRGVMVLIYGQPRD